jgi:transposase
METHDARTLSPEAQEDLRRRVVRAVVHQGMSQAEAVRTFGVSRTSVYSWLKAHNRDGVAGLKAKPRGRPKRSRLQGWQAATVVNLITDRCPDQLRLPFALWTRDAVRELLAERFEVHVSVWTVGRYLADWGLTPQKPLRRAYEQNPEAVQRWLTREYPAIRRQARVENAEIHWGDEMGVRSDHQVGRSYGLRGKTPVIPGTGKRFGCNMISTITNRGQLAFMVFTERFTSVVMIKFLRRLIKHSKRKVYLIIDRHPVHRARKVRQWIHARSHRIRLFHLPDYSPELNPDELLNQDVKSNAVGRQRPENQPTMMRQVRSYLRSTQRQPQIVRDYFQEQHVAYAAL